MTRPVAGLAIVLTLTPALAFAAPDCTSDMAGAHARIATIQARDPKLDPLMKAKDVKAVCAILKADVADMTAARDAMVRCLPDGFDKTADVTNLNANLAKLAGAITQHCA